MEKAKLQRCGVCGDWLQDPRLYTEEEQNNPELTYCSVCGNEEMEHQRFEVIYVNQSCT